jgi:hypothetical protein
MNKTTMICKTFMHQFDGHVFVEPAQFAGGGTINWVARLECTRCGTRRVDVMTPMTCVLISRKYDYTGCVDYDRTVERTDAKKALFKLMLKG